MKLKGKISLVTGASSGIGLACADQLAGQGSNLILFARRIEKLREISAQLTEKYGVEVLPIECDVRNYDEVEKVVKNLPENWKKIDFLVNNAGLARGIDKLHEGDLRNWEEMIDTNVKGLLYVSRLILPGMVERGSGHVVNIGSLAGHEVYPNGNVYCGSKHAVKAISKGMIIDLNGTGVKATNIDPGLVETEFSIVRFRGDESKAKTVYKGYEPLHAEDVADAVIYAVSRPKHVLIQEMLLTPEAQATSTIVDRKN